MRASQSYSHEVFQTRYLFFWALIIFTTLVLVALTGPQPWDVVCKKQTPSGVCCASNHPREPPCRHASILLSGTKPWQLNRILLILLVILEGTVSSHVSRWLFWNSTLPDIFYIWAWCVLIYIILYVCFVFFIIYIYVGSSYYAGIIVGISSSSCGCISRV